MISSASTAVVGNVAAAATAVGIVAENATKGRKHLSFYPKECIFSKDCIIVYITIHLHM